MWRHNHLDNANAPSRSVIRRGLYDDELHNIREYRGGDNSRAIHWRTTARKGEVMVREYEQDRESELTILLDLQRPAESNPELEELAVSLVATLCHDQVSRSQAGAFALLIAGRKTVEVRSAGGASFRKAAFDALATCQSSGRVDLLPLAEAACEAVATPQSRCVIVTARSREFWEAATAIDRERSTSGFPLHGRITVIPMNRERILEVFSPPESSDDGDDLPVIENDESRMESLLEELRHEEAMA